MVMREDLTKRYSFLFERRGLQRLFSFLQDVYRSGKAREITSFLVWEVFHRLKLFPPKAYLEFSPEKPLGLERVKLDSANFHERIALFFKSKGLGLTVCSTNWKLVFKSGDGEIFGSIYPDDQNLYKSTLPGTDPVLLKRFPERIKSLFVSSEKTIFVCVLGAVYRSSDRGTTFQRILDLGSAASFFRFNNAMTELPGNVLLIGEYGNVWEAAGWKNLANLYYSFNDGSTWQTSEFLKRRGTNKHVHIVAHSRLLNRILIADGDNHKRLWLSDALERFNFDRPNWKAANRFHIQMGGYTSFVETGEKILFGTDYQGGTNFIVETKDGRKFTKRVVPDPYRRSPVDNMVLRKTKAGCEIWANLPYSTAGTKCLLMYSKDDGASWERVIEYDRAAYTVWLIQSSNQTEADLYFSIEDLKTNDRVVYRVADPA